jgi:hypothetical protein
VDSIHRQRRQPGTLRPPRQSAFSFTPASTNDSILVEVFYVTSETGCRKMDHRKTAGDNNRAL